MAALRYNFFFSNLLLSKNHIEESDVVLIGFTENLKKMIISLSKLQQRHILKAMNELLQGNPYAIKDGAAGAPGAAEMNAAWPSATALQPTGYYTGYDHPSLAAYG